MNKNNTKIVKLLKKEYNDKSIQLPIAYSDNITILDANNLLYHHKEGFKKYLNTTNNNEFYKKRIGLKEYNVINEQYLYNIPYIVINNNQIMEYYTILNENNSPLLIKEELAYDNVKTVYMNRLEIEKLLGKRDEEKFYILNDEGKLYMYNNNAMILEYNFFIPSEEQVINDFKIKKLAEISENKNKFMNYDFNILESYYKNMNLDNLGEQISIFDNDIITIRTEDNNIEIKDLYIKLVGENKYKVQIMDLYVKDYNINDIKESNIRITKNRVLKK